MFAIFKVKKRVAFNLTSFGTGKYDCAINTKEIISFQSLINKSVTIGRGFLVLIISLYRDII